MQTSMNSCRLTKLCDWSYRWTQVWFVGEEGNDSEWHWHRDSAITTWYLHTSISGHASSSQWVFVVWKVMTAFIFLNNSPYVLDLHSEDGFLLSAVTVVGFYHFSDLPPRPPSSCFRLTEGCFRATFRTEIIYMYIKVSWVLLHSCSSALCHAGVLKIIINLYSFKMRLQCLDVSLVCLLPWLLSSVVSSLSPLIRSLVQGQESEEWYWGKGSRMFNLRKEKGGLSSSEEHGSVHLGKDRAHGLKKSRG